MEGQHYLPKYLNALPQVLWWELDDLMVLGMFTSIGIMVNMQITFGIIGIVLTNLYSKYKRKKQPGFLRHYLYSKGLYGLKGRIPEYWIKELVE